MNDEPLAFYLTWTVYGTFLQGDLRGWRKWRKGHQLPQPRLAQWRAERLQHEIILFDDAKRDYVSAEIERLCTFRKWKLWAKNVRTNHVHAVIHAPGYTGAKVRDQLKANCTRVLRSEWPIFVDRPVWTEGGDWECINELDDLDQVINYVLYAQDRHDITNDYTTQTKETSQMYRMSDQPEWRQPRVGFTHRTDTTQQTTTRLKPMKLLDAPQVRSAGMALASGWRLRLATAITDCGSGRNRTLMRSG